MALSGLRRGRLKSFCYSPFYLQNGRLLARVDFPPCSSRGGRRPCATRRRPWAAHAQRIRLKGDAQQTLRGDQKNQSDWKCFTSYHLGGKDSSRPQRGLTVARRGRFHVRSGPPFITRGGNNEDSEHVCVAALMLAGASAVASASPLPIGSLTGIVFDDGGTVSGSFTLDAGSLCFQACAGSLGRPGRRTGIFGGRIK
jgi:hypothetical protein